MGRHVRNAFAVVGTIVLIGGGVFGAGPADKSAQVDALFAKCDGGGSPGAAVVVVQDGTVVDHYGFGWVLGKHRGLDEVRATGMMPGFESQIIRIPSQRFSVIVLSNCNGLDVFDLAHRIAEIYLAEPMEALTPGK